MAVEDDPNLKAILDSGVKAAAIFGKTWDLHVKEALRTTLEENLRMIAESIRYLKSHGLEVIYDAEHFSTATKANPEFALETVREAAKAGADFISLCDTSAAGHAVGSGGACAEAQRRACCALGHSRPQ